MDGQAGLSVVGLYAGLNGFILLWLAINVGTVRRRQGISMGDGQDPAMIRAMRGQANFVEYVPFCLVALGLLAAQGAGVLALHAMGAALTVGRLLHGWHFVQSDAPGWQREIGTGLTFLVLLASCVWLVVDVVV